MEKQVKNTFLKNQALRLLSLCLLTQGFWHCPAAPAQQIAQLIAINSLERQKIKELNAKIKACYQSGDLAKAVPLAKEIVDILERDFPENAEDLYQSIQSYAVLLKHTGKDTEAVAALKHLDALKQKLQYLQDKKPLTKSELNLAGKTFRSKIDQQAYLKFEDSQMVEAKGEYVRFDGTTIDLLEGNYRVVVRPAPLDYKAEVKITFLWSGTNRIAKYDLYRENGKLELWSNGEVRPFPRLVLEESSW